MAEWVIRAYRPSQPRRNLLSMEADIIRVLVVDDHALHRDGIRQILGQQPDIEVVGEAESAERALVLVNQLNPSLVLMDIRLPGMNGIDATRRIRRNHPGTRVLVVTAYDDDEYVRSALEAGASGHLSKAAPGRELVEAVRAVAAGGTVIEPLALTHLLAGVNGAPLPASELTERELAVLKLLAEGLHNKQVATRLGISRRTVERHCDSIYAKLGVGSRTEAVVHAISSRLVSLPDDHH
jgi:DNA-binding NarL/FixJ family response regulator